MTPLDILKGARELLSDPAKWTKGKMASNADGRECFCALGAMKSAAGVQLFSLDYSDELVTAVSDFRKSLSQQWDDSIVNFNDHHGTKHEHVLAVFDRAIARAQGSQP